jgi:hypothetical protein
MFDIADLAFNNVFLAQECNRQQAEGSLMPYCSQCGDTVDDSARFCSHCANPLTGDGLSGEEALVGNPGSTLGLDDVPWWLGALAIPFGGPLILPIFCIWAYRRGRKDGVGREPTDEPYAKFFWRIAAWSVVNVLPFYGWVYVRFHLPTLCYKHGLRVGAAESLWIDSEYSREQVSEVVGITQRKAPAAFTSLPAMSAVGCSIIGAILLSLVSLLVVAAASPAESNAAQTPVAVTTPRPRPATPKGPSLTGAEAAGKVEASLRKSITESGRNDLSYACDWEDYNAVTEKWIVSCLVVGPANSINYRATVDDRTGRVSQIQ